MASRALSRSGSTAARRHAPEPSAEADEVAGDANRGILKDGRWRRRQRKPVNVISMEIGAIGAAVRLRS